MARPDGRKSRERFNYMKALDQKDLQAFRQDSVRVNVLLPKPLLAKIRWLQFHHNARRLVTRAHFEDANVNRSHIIRVALQAMFEDRNILAELEGSPVQSTDSFEQAVAATRQLYRRTRATSRPPRST